MRDKKEEAYRMSRIRFILRNYIRSADKRVLLIYGETSMIRKAISTIEDQIDVSFFKEFLQDVAEEMKEERDPLIFFNEQSIPLLLDALYEIKEEEFYHSLLNFSQLVVGRKRQLILIQEGRVEELTWLHMLSNSSIIRCEVK